MKNIYVSIIVPVYDVEPYLRRCLDSLINQTLKEIEIICINDCSPDNSLAMLREYAKNDDRIQIIDFKKNRGVNAARNSGIKIAKGKYVGFCDPDDYVDLDFFEKLYALAKERSADIAKGSVKILNWESKLETINNVFVQKPKYHLVMPCWICIYKKSMIDKHCVRFPVANVIINSGDGVFTSHAAIVAKKVVVLTDSYYHHIKRNDSLDSKVLSKEKCISRLFCATLIFNRLNVSKVSKPYYIYMYKAYFRHAIGNLLSRTSDADATKEIAKSAIVFYSKCKFPQKLNLPAAMVAAIDEKDDDKLIHLLQEWVQNGCCPTIDIKQSILQNRKLYIWGAGLDGSVALKQCERNRYKIEGFLDSNPSITEFQGHNVLPPQSLLNSASKDFFIIINSRAYADEIAKICKQAGLKEGADFWMP